MRGKISKGSMAVLVYSMNDKVDAELTRSVSDSFRAAGVPTLSLQQTQRLLPSYPKDFFLDKPFVRKDDKYNIYAITKVNAAVVSEARRKLNTDYLLFILCTPAYSGVSDGLVDFKAVSFDTWSFLINSSGETVLYMSAHYRQTKSEITLLPAPSSINGAFLAAVDAAAEHYVGEYLRNVRGNTP